MTKKRSVDGAAAPLVENACCKCKTKLMRIKKSDSYICDDCMDILHAPGGDSVLVEKLATSASEAAVVRYLRRMARESQFEVFRAVWDVAADHIERGEHVK